MTLSPDQIREMLSEPEYAAQMADLVYINDSHLTIHRKPYGRGFTYLVNNKDRLKDKLQLKRIKSLVIPPAWQQVRISVLENGHLQVVGRDDKQRKVYLYHNLWNTLRNQTKFFKMSAFAKALPLIRQRIEKDLDQELMTRTKCLALVLKVMDKTHIRVGSQYYADKNSTYGLSTLRTRHLNETGAALKFEFKGKKGVMQSQFIDDPELTDLIHQSEEIPGWELFQYYDEKGNHHAIDSGMVNDYLREIAGDMFSAKDFRTWGASTEFFNELTILEYTNDDKQRSKNVIQALDAAAAELGNTRSVCKQYYVHPQLVELYVETGYRDFYQGKMNYNDTAYFSKKEYCIEQIINEFEIQFKEEKLEV
jgi:DNA topoisomerase-1